MVPKPVFRLFNLFFDVDSSDLFSTLGFIYDGEGPAAYFYVGNSQFPGNQSGFRLRDEKGSTRVLGKYRNKDITLTLPEGKTLRDIKWFSGDIFHFHMFVSISLNLFFSMV